MGGCCYRTKESPTIKELNSSFPAEWTIISDKEKEIPFAKVSLNRLEECLNRYQFGYRLNKPNIRIVLEELNLNIKLLNDPESLQFKFFEAFIDTDKLYTLRKLVLSAALTSQEPIKLKVEIIGKYFDFEDNKSLEEDEILEFLKEIVDVSAKILPLIAVSDDPDISTGGFITEETYKKFTDNLMQGKKRFLMKYSDLILSRSSSLTYAEFTARFNRKELSILLSANEIRNELYNLVKN